MLPDALHISRSAKTEFHINIGRPPTRSLLTSCSLASQDKHATLQPGTVGLLFGELLVRWSLRSL